MNAQLEEQPTQPDIESAQEELAQALRDAAATNPQPLEISGAAFAAIFGSPAPNTTTSLATILQEAIYNAAIAAGIMSGTVSPG